FLNFAPDTHCEYCTLSFAVMAELIVRLGGQPYPDYLRDRVFAPAGMGDTSFRPRDGRRAAPVHNFGDGAQLEAFTERAVAGGGLWSTAADLVKFGQAFLRGSHDPENPLLSPAAVAMMTRDHNAGRTTTPGAGATPFPYGLGWGKPY